MGADLTQLLRRWNQGEREALDELFPLVYADLRRLARSALRRERSDHTLQPTALVACSSGLLTGPCDHLLIEATQSSQ